MGIVRIITFVLLPIFLSAQDWPRFELYQLKQGIDSGQFVTTGVDSNLDFNSVLRFRFQDSTLLIGADTVITDATIVPILLATIDAGLGIEVNQVNGQIFIESLSIEDSIYNGSDSIIPKGTPLYASDTQGNYWDVAPARADDPTKMPVVAIAGDEIGIGEVGLGLIKGHIKQVNTTGLADGSQVYVGATGGYTSTKPTDEGVIIQRLGTVIKGDVEKGSGIINLGDEGLWNDYTSLSEFRDTVLAIRADFPAGGGDVTTAQLADTALAIRGDIPSQISDSLLNYVTINTTQTITGEKTFNTDVEINGKLDLLTDALSVFIGTNAGRIEDGVNRRNIGIGNNALYTSDEGNNNIAIGYNSNYKLIDAANNIGIGNASLYSNESGSRNIGIGRNSLYVNEAESNVAVGYESFYWNETGSNNVAYGMRAGNNTNSEGQNKNTNNSVFIGYNTKALSTADTNEIVIGYEAKGLGTNTAVIGNTSITKLNSNKYTFNVDQDTTGKDGQVLTFNSSSGEIELDSVIATGIIVNSITFNNSGTGDVSGTTFDGSAAKTISYNTIGSPGIDGTNATGTWGIDITGKSNKSDSFLVVSSSDTSFMPVLFSNTYSSYTTPAVTQNLQLNPSLSDFKILNTNVLLENSLQSGFLMSYKQNDNTSIVYSDGSVYGISEYYMDDSLIMNIAGLSDDLYIFNPNGNGNIYIGTTTDSIPLTAISITDDREVGINRPTPSYTLDVNGDSRISTLNSGKTIPVYHTSGVLGVNGSDIRIKENIEKFENILNKVKQMNVVRFQYKSSGINDFGFIAQELMQPLPELVFQNETDGFYGVHYEKLGVIAIKAIQEQQIIIESQDKRIRQLEEMVKQLIEKN